jgi:heme iron utilization protein
LPAKTNPARRFLLHASGQSLRRFEASPRVLDLAPPAPRAGGMSGTSPSSDAAGFARRLVRSRERGALATSLRGMPYASLVLVAADLDASPLLLLSDLAQHSRNIAFDPRVSLLLDATEGHPDPLAGPRLTLLGRAEAVAEPALFARFIARHPSSAIYAGFADFRLYRMAVERGHLVAGFGRIEWIEGGDLVFASDAGALAKAEPSLLADMNEDHPDLIELYAQRLLGRAGSGWRMTGIDPEGIDLRNDRETARLEFAAPVLTPPAARTALERLADKAPR